MKRRTQALAHTIHTKSCSVVCISQI